MIIWINLFNSFGVGFLIQMICALYNKSETEWESSDGSTLYSEEKSEPAEKPLNRIKDSYLE